MMDPVTSFLLLTVLLSLYFYLTRNFGYWESQGVKCDKPWPIIGTLKPYWRESSFKQDMDNYKKFGSVYGFYEGSRPCLNVAEPELLKKIFVKNFAAFPNHRHMGKISKKNLFTKFLINLEGEEWKTARHAISPTFSTKRLKPFAQAVNNNSKQFIAAIEKKLELNEPICLRKTFAYFGLDSLGSYSMGLKIDSLQNDGGQLYSLLSKIFTSSTDTLFFFIILFPFIFKLFGLFIQPKEIISLHKIIMTVISKRLSNEESRCDPLDVILKHKDDIDMDILCMQNLFFLTGGDGTGLLASLFCYEMAINPDCQEKLIAEIDEVIMGNNGNFSYEDIRNMEYLDMVVSEILRKYPPLLRLERSCSEDGFNLDGIKLKFGMLITIPVYSIHYDEKYWTNPAKFIPERFNRENKAKQTPFTYMPFGIGPRSCVANRLGLMSLKLTTVHFFSRFRVKPTPTTQIPLEIKTIGFGALIVESMYLNIEKRTDAIQMD